MLVLSRHAGEKIICVLPDGQKIEIVVCGIRSRKSVQIGIKAPRSILVDRQEVIEQKLKKHQLSKAA